MREKTQKLIPKLRFPEFQDALEWKIKTVGKVVEFLDGQRKPIRESDRASIQGQYPYYGASGIIDYINDFIFDEDLILLGEDGENIVSRNLPLVFKVSGKCWVNNHAHVLKPNKPHNLDFLVQYMENLSYIKYNSGGAQPKLNQAVCKTIPLLLPQPKEQQKIADCLSSIDELITAQTKKIAALKDHKKGLMQQLFPLEGETIPKLRFPEFQDAKEWVEKPLAKVCDVLQGFGFPEVLQGKNEGKYPFCKVSDISRAVAEKGGILSEATNYIGDDELLKLRAKLIPEGSTVFAKIGEALRLNRRAYVQKACLIDNNATGLKAIEGVALDYFVYLMSQLIDLNEYCGGAVPSVNKTTLEEIKVIVPKPEEQQKIADCLSSIDELIATQTQKLEAYKAHKIGLMQQLFPDTDKVSE